ncbi:MAG: rhodanese-like domain-containing protein [Thermomicrobiales bacterium]
MVATITRDELKAVLDQGKEVAIVEALPEQYYRKAHLPGALLMPHDQVDQLAPTLLPDRSAEIVVYCANLPCENSEAAARRLIELGYTNVRDYAEGKQDWIDARLPTESGAAAGVAHGAIR